MFRLWAVARHTFRQCLRMKVAGLFIILLAVGLGVLPFLMEGDGTLAGRIRTFLSYGATMTAVLLGLVTIFLSTAVITSDVRGKQIFSVATKPISRWQYILGRWLGVVLLDAVLLAVAGGAIYFLAQYLRTGKALNPTDRRAVETEIFAARERVSPEPLRINAAVEARKKSLMEDGSYEDTLEQYAILGGLDRKAADLEFTKVLYKQLSESMQSVAPNRAMVWRFSGIRVAGKETRGSGLVREISRTAKGGLILIESNPRMIGKLVYRGPVRISGVDGRVERLGTNGFYVGFGLEEMSRGELSVLKLGKNVEIVADPTIQITYKATPASRPPKNILVSQNEVQNPSGVLMYSERREDFAEVPVTLTVSARLVDEDGHTVVRYINVPDRKTGFSTSVTILWEDVGVLYKVGSFGPNFVRGMAMIFVQLVFLAGLGVMAGSFASFPVACLVCFTVLPFQIAREYLSGAMHPRYAGRGVFGFFSTSVVTIMNKLLPDFSRTSPADSLVDGMNISWAFLGETYLWTLCVQTGLLLIIACLIFRKRELARVQV